MRPAPGAWASVSAPGCLARLPGSGGRRPRPRSVRCRLSLGGRSARGQFAGMRIGSHRVKAEEHNDS